MLLLYTVGAGTTLQSTDRDATGKGSELLVTLYSSSAVVGARVVVEDATSVYKEGLEVRCVATEKLAGMDYRTGHNGREVGLLPGKTWNLARHPHSITKACLMTSTCGEEASVHAC
jgi:hypothetical protein